MAGLKNMYQIYGMTPTNTVNGENPFERDMAFRAMQYTPYCRVCGQEILEAKQDEFGGSVDYERELYFMAHERCMQSKYRY